MKIIYRYEIIMSILIVVLIAISGFSNIIVVVSSQGEDNIQLLNSSKEFIMGLFNQVNNLSTSYQNTLVNLNFNQSIDTNLTIASETDEYIDGLERIIGEAKKYNLQEEYKPVLDSYINSLQNEINSYAHYKNYLLTGNKTENTLSINLLSKAYDFETEAIKDFNELQ